MFTNATIRDCRQVVIKLCRKTHTSCQKTFFLGAKVTDVTQSILGKILVTNGEDNMCKGRIVEVEAYCGRNDKACHANNGKRTKRTEVMYQQGGCAYVYLCYGIHYLFNVVTNENGLADAVLIRAVEPIQGLGVMKFRSSKKSKLTKGPGLLSRAMGIDTQLSGDSLSGPIFWLENPVMESDFEVIHATRIGVDFAEEDALLPWRYYIKGNEWVSKF
ncbi:MAG: DNA-3-methyladenine glycosylase [Reichenbachiella sp.]